MPPASGREREQKNRLFASRRRYDCKRLQVGIPPALPAMLLGIMEDVASLAQGSEVLGRVVGRIMVEMRAGQDHVGGSNDPRREAAAKLQALTAIGAPHTVLSIPPAPVPEMSDRLQVRPLAPFAALSGALETHPLR